MKSKIAILIFISILLFSCAPATPTQEDEVVEIATEEIVTNAIATPEPIATEEPTPTETPAEVPTETPIACVTLLSPENGVKIPPVGKVTFSWTAMEGAGKYVLTSFSHRVILSRLKPTKLFMNATWKPLSLMASINGRQFHKIKMGVKFV